MSIEKLKSIRDEVVRGEIGLHLEVTQKLLAAIDAHIADFKPVEVKIKKTAVAVENAVGEAAGQAFENRQ